MNMNIALVPGDGIGPDIVREAVRVLDKVAEVYGHSISYKEVDAGGVSIDKYGIPLTDSALETAASSDAVLLGAVGGPKWDHVPGNLRPEKALLGLRSGLGLFCNLRPAVIYPELADASPLKPSVISEGVDLLVVRELTGGIYFGEKGRNADGSEAFDVMKYSVKEIERIAKKAFEAARLRKKHVTLVDKANVLETSRLWRETVKDVHARKYADMQLDFLFVDNAAMKMVSNPRDFDVILTENMFGDILSDLAGVINGSIGLLPSASCGSERSLYEPIHGSAPRMVEEGLAEYANPASILKACEMMLRHVGFSDKADRLAEALAICLEEEKKVVVTGTSDGAKAAEFGDYVASKLK